MLVQTCLEAFVFTVRSDNPRNLTPAGAAAYGSRVVESGRLDWSEVLRGNE
jgi:hypothetical protein